MSTERANGGQRSHSRTNSSARGAAVQSSQAPQRASGEVGAFQIDDEDDDDGDGDDGEQSMSGNASRTRDETRDSFTDAASHVAGDESEDGHQRMPSNEFGSDCNDEDDYDEDAALAAALGAGGYTPYLGRLTAVACLGGLQFGWDTGIAAGMLVAIHQDLGHSLSAMEQEFIVSATTVGAIVGALSAGRLSDWMGRKKVMITAGIFFALGSIEQAASQVVRELILGRVIVGLGVGMASMVVPTYLAECAPPAIRGQIVSINALLITGGQVVAYVVDAAFYSLPHGWRWMVLAGGAPALIQLVGLIYLDESPRWLVAHGRHTSARHVLSRIYPEASPDTITRQIARIEDSISGSHLPFPAPSVSDVGSKAGQLREQFQQLWSDRSGRKALVLACGLQACQQLVGANSILYYSSRLLLMAGFKTNPNVAAIWIAVANFIGTAIALRLIDRTGRRMLLLRATAGATISLAFLAIALSQIDTGEVTDGGLGDVNQAAPGAWTYICLLAVRREVFIRGAIVQSHADKSPPFSRTTDDFVPLHLCSRPWDRPLACAE